MTFGAHSSALEIMRSFLAFRLFFTGLSAGLWLIHRLFSFQHTYHTLCIRCFSYGCALIPEHQYILKLGDSASLLLRWRRLHLFRSSCSRAVLQCHPPAVRIARHAGVMLPHFITRHNSLIIFDGRYNRKNHCFYFNIYSHAPSCYTVTRHNSETELN